LRNDQFARIEHLFPDRPDIVGAIAIREAYIGAVIGKFRNSVARFARTLWRLVQYRVRALSEQGLSASHGIKTLINHNTSPLPMSVNAGKSLKPRQKIENQIQNSASNTHHPEFKLLRNILLRKRKSRF
jgi:hypothetical protein